MRQGLHPKLAVADRLDAEGRHDDAVNELAMAIQAGDLEAMVRLGKRLFVGDRAPYLPRDGAGFLLEAATKGHAEAVALMAVFQCTGIFQRKSWSDAITTLAHAAQLGHVSAREQLLLLTQGPTGELVTPKLPSGSEGEWTRLARNIDLSAWFSAPEGRVIHDDPLLKSFPAFLPPAFSQRLIAQSRTRLKPARVYDPVNKRDIHSGTRTNSIAEYNLVENELLHFLLQERMAQACGVPMNHCEATAILHYNPGEEIRNHYDFVDIDQPGYEKEIAERGERIITFLIYLNDDYAAGHTAFPKLGIDHKGQAGEGFFFTNALPNGKPDHRVLHAGTPPRTGEKWIVSQFIRNKPVNYVQVK
ncbi:MAG TPA: 2OG-Fe(II) oxygenase [Candidatus Acidoferrum sp.]|nr:2OG-Fe(II) oxygenase [Candidatus Acidoferrum sp.]